MIKGGLAVLAVISQYYHDFTLLTSHPPHGIWGYEKYKNKPKLVSYFMF